MKRKGLSRGWGGWGRVGEQSGNVGVRVSDNGERLETIS